MVGFIILAFMVAILAIATKNFVDPYSMDLPKSSTIDQAMDLLGMLICIILFVTTLFDHRMTSSTIYFMSMVAQTHLLIFWDFEAWLMDGIPVYATPNAVLNYYILRFALLIMLTFWPYVKQLIMDRTKALKFINITYYALFAVGLATILSNAFFGQLFTINPYSGLYSRGPDYNLTLLCPAIMLIMHTIVTAKYIKGRRQKFGLYSFTFFPVVTTVLQTIFFGINTLYIAILMSLLLIYRNFYVERGQELVRKEGEIIEQNIMLRISQIQPDFLDRALKSIQNIEGNPEETKEGLERFARYMHRNLDTLSETEAIPFEKEIKHVETYAYLEKLRFKDKLTVYFEIGDRDFNIPAPTLQMLVENAIKHGITVKEGGGTVIVRTEEGTDRHRIIVSDDGVGFDTQVSPSDKSRSHIGLSNISTRLREMVGGRLEIHSAIGQGTVAVVTIPKETYSIK